MIDEEINIKVAQWHEGDSGKDLYEYLGMTWEEYCDWVVDKVERSK